MEAPEVRENIMDSLHTWKFLKSGKYNGLTPCMEVPEVRENIIDSFHTWKFLKSGEI